MFLLNHEAGCICSPYITMTGLVSKEPRAVAVGRYCNNDFYLLYTYDTTFAPLLTCMMRLLG